MSSQKRFWLVSLTYYDYITEVIKSSSRDGAQLMNKGTKSP